MDSITTRCQTETIYQRNEANFKNNFDKEETPNGQSTRLVINQNQVGSVLKMYVAEFVDQKTDLTLVELLLNDRYNAIRESDIFEEFTLFAAAVSFQYLIINP